MPVLRDPPTQRSAVQVTLVKGVGDDCCKCLSLSEAPKSKICVICVICGEWVGEAPE